MIDCEATNSTTNSFTIAIGATNAVTVRGLMIETAQGAAGGTRISFTGSGTLILEKLQYLVANSTNLVQVTDFMNFSHFRLQLLRLMRLFSTPAHYRPI